MLIWNIIKINNISLKKINNPFTFIDVKGYDYLYVEGSSFPIESDLTKFNKKMKRPYSTEELVSRFKENNVFFSLEEEDRAKKLLRTVNYYKISIFVKLCKEDPIFFSDIYNIYKIDKHIRKSLLPFLMEIELLIKANLTSFLTLNYSRYKKNNDFQNYPKIDDSLFYLDYSIYETDKTKKIREILSNFSFDTSKKINKEQYIRHHIINYGGNVPFWVLVEVLTMGQINYFINFLSKTIRKEWVQQLLPQPFDENKILEWLKTVQYLRNDCAHDNRLFGKSFTYNPGLHHDDLVKIIGEKNLYISQTKKKQLNSEDKDRKDDVMENIRTISQSLFGGLLIVKRFCMLLTEDSKKLWNEELVKLDKMSKELKVNLSDTNFPVNWLEILEIDNV